MHMLFRAVSKGGRGHADVVAMFEIKVLQIPHLHDLR